MKAHSIIDDVKRSGLRMTPIREKILELLNHTRTPVSVPDVLKDVPVNKTTIYREMETLTSKGYLTEVDFGDGIKRYELSLKGHHHHLVCVKCRSITDYVLPRDFTREEKRIARTKKFTVLRHTLEFFGLCRRCREA